MADVKEKDICGSQSTYSFSQEKSFFEESGVLPLGYGDNRIVLLPRDTKWLYTYWEINEQKKNEAKEKFGSDIFQRINPNLRVYDVTAIDFNGFNAHNWFDLDINSKTDNWYINVNTGGRSYCVDIGLLIPEEGFFVLARSNVVTLPSGKISDITDEEWMLVSDKLMKLAGIDKIGRSSLESKSKLLYEIEKVLSVTSPGISPSGMWVKPEARGFWLVADAELTIYGATEPDAELSVQGQRIPLKSDGTFSLRFSLPDGTQEIPIEALSRDKKEKRRIKIVVDRQTT